MKAVTTGASRGATRLLPEDRLAAYFDYMAETGHSRERLRFQLDFLFRGIDLSRKTVLDVGAGNGIYSLFAACAGAGKVVSIEPEAAGSSDGSIAAFEQAASQLRLENVELIRSNLQNYETDLTFDVLLLLRVINHLDERACIDLHRDPQAQNVYRAIFQKLSNLSAPRANVVIVECSPSNLYPRLGLRNPFAPSIEWHKHQPPELWARLSREAGFRNPKIRWGSFNSAHGRLLLGNRLGAYVRASTFTLTLEKS